MTKINRQTMIYKTLRRKLSIEQHEPHKIKRKEGKAVSAPLVAPVVYGYENRVGHRYKFKSI
jgi:hypothetical protein